MPKSTLSEAAREQFEDGIVSLFSFWTALNLAVENEWGGAESSEKREFMVDSFMEYFDEHGTAYEIDDLEEWLVGFMGDCFGIDLEDDSEVEVAKRMAELYSDCVKGDFSQIEALRAKREARRQQGQTSTRQSRSEPVVDDDGFTAVTSKRGGRRV
ncbi:hypothetical protein GQ42DRAFT_153101 [Ramicandelaber brevisporus]|nr:hypothetical protein GQ42DRAFT_153101 [Ramicandelaber brevisporus]